MHVCMQMYTHTHARTHAHTHTHTSIQTQLTPQPLFELVCIQTLMCPMHGQQWISFSEVSRSHWKKTAEQAMHVMCSTTPGLSIKCKSVISN